ncbi:MAG: hypothetical protein HY332_00360 [Chloroflexi bacterium]|nr:hypothetical protein [Chloroflexota bacterium]
MEQLRLDFNNRDERDWVRIGPAAAARISAFREQRLAHGDRVEVLDEEGNRCLGVLREDPTRPRGHRWYVELDWSTWIDADTDADPGVTAAQPSEPVQDRRAEAPPGLAR